MSLFEVLGACQNYDHHFLLANIAKVSESLNQSCLITMLCSNETNELLLLYAAIVHLDYVYAVSFIQIISKEP